LTTSTRTLKLNLRTLMHYGAVHVASLGVLSCSCSTITYEQSLQPYGAGNCRLQVAEFPRFLLFSPSLSFSLSHLRCSQSLSLIFLSTFPSIFLFHFLLLSFLGIVTSKTGSYDITVTVQFLLLLILSGTAKRMSTLFLRLLPFSAE
jgi:hypothetical protein